MVDARMIEKYEREAKEKNRESWFLAYILDTNEEERAKGKTVEVGRAFFTTETVRHCRKQWHASKMCFLHPLTAHLKETLHDP